MEILRDLAICMFFYVEYTKENVKKYKKRIEDLNAVEICYNTSPNQPILVSLERIYESPHLYHKYPTISITPDRN